MKGREVMGDSRRTSLRTTGPIDNIPRFCSGREIFPGIIIWGKIDAISDHILMPRAGEEILRKESSSIFFRIFKIKKIWMNKGKDQCNLIIIIIKCIIRNNLIRRKKLLNIDAVNIINFVKSIIYHDSCVKHTSICYALTEEGVENVE